MALVRKDVMNLTIPVLFEQAFVMSLGMINTMMAGSIGKEAVSAIGMVDTINNIFIAFFSALAVGGTVVVAQYIGQKNIKRANDAMKQALYSGLILSAVITITTWILKKQLVGVLYGNAEGKVIEDAYIYLGITLLTYPLIAIDLIANGILRGAGDTKTPMKITIFMNFVNVILSYFFINGIHIKNEFLNINILGMGIQGAATGIAIARITGAVIVIAVLIRGSEILKLTNVNKFKFDKELISPIFGIGIPASVESLLFNIGKLIMQIFIVDLGTASIAANTIANSITGMMNIPGNSLCIAATALVGQYMGRGKSDEAEKCLSHIIKVAAVGLLIVGVICVPFANTLASLYSNDKQIIHLSAMLIIIYAIFTPSWSLAFVLPSGLKGAGDAKYTMVTSIIGMWAFRITLGYELAIPMKLGVNGIWFGMYIDWIVRGALYYARFKKGKWKEKVVIKSVSKTA